MPQEVRKWIDSTVAENYSVSLWFKYETALMLMIEIMKAMRRRSGQNEVLCKRRMCKDKSRSEFPKETFGTGSYYVLQRPQGDETKIKTIYGALQISFFAEVGRQGQRQLAAKYTQKGDGRPNGAWQIHPEVVSQVCTDPNDLLFETVLKSV